MLLIAALALERVRRALRIPRPSVNPRPFARESLTQPGRAHHGPP